MRGPAFVGIREVGPRDGLQGEAPVAPSGRAALVGALEAAGLGCVEVAAFVSEKVVPAMAGAADVVAALGPSDGTTRVALVANGRGATAAVGSGIDALSFTISASPTYNLLNVSMPIDDSVRQLGEIVAIAGRVPVDAVVSCAFGSPYEGDIAPTEVALLGRRLIDSGATSLTFADTTGMATPRRIEELLASTTSAAGLHLHDTRGTALVNAYAAWQLGVKRFDTSVGGLGGSPLAAGAAGNLATEDLVHLLDDLGVETGVDLERLLEAAAVAGRIVGHPLPSRVSAAGPRGRRPEPEQV